MIHVPLIRNLPFQPLYDPMTALAVAGAGLQAGAQISEGFADRAWSNYHSSLAEGEARIVDIKKGIEKGQYQRAKGKFVSSAMVSTAGAGLMPTGSKMAALTSSLAQMEIDEAIGQFNYEMEKSYKIGEAEAYKRQGKRAVKQAYARGFTTFLKGSMSAFASKSSVPAGGGYSSRGNYYGPGTPGGVKDMGTFTKIR